MNWMALALGSMLGGFSRYFLSMAVNRLSGKPHPYGTLVVNVLGCFLMGLLNVLIEKRAFMGPYARMGLIIGFCGAFTTFSAYILEGSLLVGDGQWLEALLYLVGSVVLGFVSFHAGAMLANSF